MFTKHLCRSTQIRTEIHSSSPGCKPGMFNHYTIDLFMFIWGGCRIQTYVGYFYRQICSLPHSITLVIHLIFLTLWRESNPLPTYLIKYVLAYLLISMVVNSAFLLTIYLEIDSDYRIIMVEEIGFEPIFSLTNNP